MTELLQTIQKIEALYAKFGDHVPYVHNTSFSHSRKWTSFWRWLPRIFEDRRWLWLDDQDDEWSVTVASDWDSHNRGNWKAFCVYFRKDTGERYYHDYWTGVLEQTISLWQVREPAKIEFLERKIRAAVDKAYAQHLGSTIPEKVVSSDIRDESQAEHVSSEPEDPSDSDQYEPDLYESILSGKE